MKRILLLALFALPAYAQAPEMPPILVTGEERQRIIDLIGELSDANKRLGDALSNCVTTRRT